MIAASERDSLTDQVTAIVRRSAKIPLKVAIGPESRLVEDLAIDSLDLVSLVLQVQDHFDVVLEEDAVPNLCRVADIVEYLATSRARDGLQWRTLREPRVRSSSMERRGLNIRKGFLKAVLPVFRALPLPMASRVVSGIGRLEYRLSPSIRQTFDAAVAQGRTVLCGDWNSAEVSRELAGNHVLWRTRDLLLDGVPDQRALDMFTIEGKEHLEAAIGEEKGCIVLANHFGAHLLPAHWLFRANYPVRFYMERPRHISRYMSRHFQTDGPLGQDKLFISRQGVPADSASSILRAARAITGGPAAVSGGRRALDGEADRDRRSSWAGGMRFSTTWVVLAALTEAPVVMVFCRMEPDGRYHMEFRPAFHVPKDVPERGETAHWVRHFIEILEEQVRNHPTNSNDYFFWSELDAQVA